MGNKKIKIFNDLVNLIKETPKLVPPIHVAEGKVLESWIDYNAVSYTHLTLPTKA